MAISSVGIGSGLDVNSIVSQMVALEKSPLVKLQSQAASIQSKISTYAQVKSLTSTLADAASKLTRDGSWNGMSVASSKSSAVSASVTGVASATTMGISVQQLARAQSVATSAIAKDTPVGQGTLHIQLGTWVHTSAPAVFTPADTNPLAGKTIAVGANDSLTTIATKINDSNAGVTATVMRDASGERLLVRSSSTGEVSGFRITATEDATAPGLSALSFDPGAAPAVGMAANATQYGQNALAKINGIDISSATNTFSDTIQGLAITVAEVTTSEVNLSVTSDIPSMKKNVQDFVDAYNELNELLSESTKYDETSKTAGVLQGDSSTVGLQSALRMLTMSAVGGDAALQRLSDIGISMARGGNLNVNTSKLDTALKDPAALKGLFAAPAGTSGSTGGIAVQFKGFADGLLAYEGMMNNKKDSLEASVKRNTAEQDRVNERAAVVEKRLRAQYTALDVKMGSLSALSSYISQQVTSWNKPS